MRSIVLAVIIFGTTAAFGGVCWQPQLKSCAYAQDKSACENENSVAIENYRQCKEDERAAQRAQEQQQREIQQQQSNFSRSMQQPPRPQTCLPTAESAGQLVCR